MSNRALVIGVSGVVGSTLARHLADGGWDVAGVARRPQRDVPGMRPLAADLLNRAALAAAFADERPTHVFFSVWLRQPTEAENIVVNGAMVALVTGLKHYLGPFESYGKGTLPETPFREEQPRLDVENFYYAQEDEVFAAAARDGFGWSVHRPHTIVGYALGNAMNMGVTLAVHASICREMGRPFVFPGSSVQWHGLTDMTDARLLARHLEWASTTPAARDQAFNIVDGDVFRWSWMWSRLAAWFEIEPAPFPERVTPLEKQLADAVPMWADIARRYDLVEPDLTRLASAWHTDADLGRPIEVVTDMSKSRKLGFTGYQATDDAFYDLFARLRASHVIPDRPSP